MAVQKYYVCKAGGRATLSLQLGCRTVCVPSCAAGSVCLLLIGATAFNPSQDRVLQGLWSVFGMGRIVCTSSTKVSAVSGFRPQVNEALQGARLGTYRMCAAEGTCSRSQASDYLLVTPHWQTA
eukprot:scaffold12632_cov22-Tisochrysis_lutea.AAC.1